MGGTWFAVDFKEEGAGAGGYAKESSEAFKEAQKKTFHKHAKEAAAAAAAAAAAVAAAAAAALRADGTGRASQRRTQCQRIA